MRTKESNFLAKESYPFIGGSLALSYVFYKLNLKPLLLSGMCFAAFNSYFFRNPKRNVVESKNDLLAPADGKVLPIKMAYERYFFKKNVIRISIFMSLFNVHINRSPISGTLIDKIYNKGKFFKAYKEKASLDNEQIAMLIETEYNRRIVVVQIAGFVARRIVNYKKNNEFLKQGEIIGLIKFGSRVDVYVENKFEAIVKNNDRVKAGESLLGVLKT